MPAILIDAGPLTALLNPNDEFHAWARAIMRQLPAPLFTSEPVLAEVSHLLQRDGCDSDELFALAEKDVIRVGIRFEHERTALRQVMARYRDVPMSLADATLVRMSELQRDSLVFTLDADFRIYRRHRNNAIPVLMPEG
jgi:predicted nucleic acid-binding protein